MTKRRRCDSIAAEAKFRTRLAELGAALLEPEYLGGKYPHHVRCSAGHDCYPRPGNVNHGRGICLKCARRDPVQAEEEFRARLIAMGATPLFTEWLGKDRGHAARCPAGHLCSPQPSHVRNGGGTCAVCAGNDPAAAEAQFIARLRELGATPAYDEWVRDNQKYHVICAAGHDCYPSPGSLRLGRGPCKICANQDPATAAAGFRDRLALAGATLLDDDWRGANAHYRVICAAGHECMVRPGQIQQGYGPCRWCAGKEWDAFYVVTSPDAVKFGITSGNGHHRLGVHAWSGGFREVVRLATGLPGTLAPDTERAVIAALADAGERPLKGREYFPAHCLALILDVADSWLATAA